MGEWGEKRLDRKIGIGSGLEGFFVSCEEHC